MPQLPAKSSRAISSAPFRLGALLVQPDRCVVERPEGACHLEPKVMSLLTQLADHAPAVLSRDELLDSVWADTVVSDQVLTRCISELRKALGTSNDAAHYIKTIPKKGYCLTLIPQPVGPESEAKPEYGQTQLMKNLLREDLDTVAVLPLQPLSTHQTESILGAGFARDLAGLLSLVPRIRVAASSSVEHFYAENRSPIEIAQLLDARYLVSGSIEFGDESFRLRIELLNAKTHQQLWSERYDEKICKFYEVEDELSQRIARSLSSAIAVGKVKEIASRGAFDCDIYERIQLAEDARRNYSRSAANFIVENLSAVLDVQPHNSVAHAFLAMQLSQNLVSGWCEDAAETAQAAAAHLQEALRLSPDDSRVTMAAGIAALMRGEHPLAMTYLSRSLAQNPNEPHALAEYGAARFYVTKELAPSLALIRQAEAAAPAHPRYAIWAYRRGICHYEMQDWHAAIEAFDDGITRTPNYHHIYLTKALALIAQGQNDLAKQMIAQAQHLAPELPCSNYLKGVQSFGLTVSEHQARTFQDLWAALGEACV